MKKHTNICIQFKKLPASLLIITILILNYCTLCFIYWNNDYKLLMTALEETEKNAILENEYYLAYRSLDLKNLNEKKQISIDGKTIIIEKANDKLLFYEAKNLKNTKRVHYYQN